MLNFLKNAMAYPNFQLSDDPFDGKRLDVSNTPVLVRLSCFGIAFSVIQSEA